MSSIAGFFQPNSEFLKDDPFCEETIHKMSKPLERRGPDSETFYHFSHGCFCYRDLSCSHIPCKIPREKHPFTKRIKEFSYTILYDGCISNIEELCQILNQKKIITYKLSQEELLLQAFVFLGPNFIKLLKGSFAMVILDETHKQLYVYRDPLGLRPLYYTMHGQTFLFASKLESLFAYPGIKPELDRTGANEIFAMGPARAPGNAVFHNIFELKAGHFIHYGMHHLYDECYHRFQIREHTDSYTDTVSHVKELVLSSISYQSRSQTPVACMLSGGLDSSFVSSVSHPKRTYSFDFPGSERYFHSNVFQPSLDAPYVHQMVDYLKADHTTLVCNNKEQYDYLALSIEAHDLPAMADIDSSLLYFCEKVGVADRVVLTGECADELFCGYPWYHRPEMYSLCTFPWTADLSPRQMLLNKKTLQKLKMEEYVQTQYQSTCSEININGANTPKEQIHQKVYYLTLRYFMQTLVNRTDRCAAYAGIDARVPFANLDLAEYLFQVPYEMKTKNGEVKHLLREISRGYLPESVRLRKKSPYPKTYDPGYEAILSSALKQIVSNPQSPILEFIDKNKVLSFCNHPKDYSKPWYGQLMAGPQLMAYLIQVNEWMERYQVSILT